MGAHRGPKLSTLNVLEPKSKCSYDLLCSYFWQNITFMWFHILWTSGHSPVSLPSPWPACLYVSFYSPVCLPCAEPICWSARVSVPIYVRSICIVCAQCLPVSAASPEVCVNEYVLSALWSSYLHHPSTHDSPPFLASLRLGSTITTNCIRHMYAEAHDRCSVWGWV